MSVRGHLASVRLDAPRTQQGGPLGILIIFFLSCRTVAAEVRKQVSREYGNSPQLSKKRCGTPQSVSYPLLCHGRVLPENELPCMASNKG